MKKRELKILVVLFLSLLIQQLHLLMSSNEPELVDWILLTDKFQDVQWYAKHMCDYLSALLLYYAIYILLPIRFKYVGVWLMIIQVLDIGNYWLFYHQFDWVYKSLVILFTITHITYRKT